MAKFGTHDSSSSIEESVKKAMSGMDKQISAGIKQALSSAIAEAKGIVEAEKKEAEEQLNKELEGLFSFNLRPSKGKIDLNLKGVSKEYASKLQDMYNDIMKQAESMINASSKGVSIDSLMNKYLIPNLNKWDKKDDYKKVFDSASSDLQGKGLTEIKKLLTERNKTEELLKYTYSTARDKYTAFQQDPKASSNVMNYIHSLHELIKAEEELINKDQQLASRGLAVDQFQAKISQNYIDNTKQILSRTIDSLYDSLLKHSEKNFNDNFENFGQRSAEAVFKGFNKSLDMFQGNNGEDINVLSQIFEYQPEIERVIKKYNLLNLSLNQLKTTLESIDSDKNPLDWLVTYSRFKQKNGNKDNPFKDISHFLQETESNKIINKLAGNMWKIDAVQNQTRSYTQYEDFGNLQPFIPRKDIKKYSPELDFSSIQQQSQEIATASQEASEALAVETEQHRANEEAIRTEAEAASQGSEKKKKGAEEAKEAASAAAESAKAQIKANEEIVESEEKVIKEKKKSKKEAKDTAKETDKEIKKKRTKKEQTKEQTKSTETQAKADIKLDAEAEKVQALDQALGRVKKSIEDKNKLFGEEESIVSKAVSSEQGALDKLAGSVSKVKEGVAKPVTDTTKGASLTELEQAIDTQNAEYLEQKRKEAEEKKKQADEAIKKEIEGRKKSVEILKQYDEIPEVGTRWTEKHGYARTRTSTIKEDKTTGMKYIEDSPFMMDYKSLTSQLTNVDKQIMTLEHDMKLVQDRYQNIDLSPWQTQLIELKKTQSEMVAEAQKYGYEDKYRSDYDQFRKAREVNQKMVQAELHKQDNINAEQAQVLIEKNKLQLENQLKSIHSAFSGTEEYKDVQFKIDNIVSLKDVEQAKNALVTLDSTVKLVKEDLKASTGSLDTVNNAFNRLGNGEHTIKTYIQAFQKLGLSAEQAKKEVAPLQDALTEWKGVNINAKGGMQLFGQAAKEFNLQEQYIKNQLELQKNENQIRRNDEREQAQTKKGQKQIDIQSYQTLIEAIKEVTTAQKQLQKVETESFKNPDPVKNYVQEIQNAKDRLEATRNELEKTVNVLYGKDLSSLTTDFFNEKSGNLLQTDSLTSKQNHRYIGALYKMQEAEAEYSRSQINNTNSQIADIRNGLESGQHTVLTYIQAFQKLGLSADQARAKVEPLQEALTKWQNISANSKGNMQLFNEYANNFGLQEQQIKRLLETERNAEQIRKNNERQQQADIKENKQVDINAYKNLVSSINAVTNAQKELQKVETESFVKPQPLVDYTKKIQEAKDRLQAMRDELEKTLQVLYGKDISALTPDFFKQSNGNLLQNDSLTVKQNNQYIDALRGMREAEDNYSRSQVINAKVQDYELIVKAINNVTTATKELQRLEQEQISKPDAFIDTDKIDEAKQRLASFKQELEDTVKTLLLLSGSKALSPTIFDSNAELTQKQKDTYKKSFTQMTETESKLELTHLNEIRQAYINYMGAVEDYGKILTKNTTGQYNAELSQQKQIVDELKVAYEQLRNAKIASGEVSRKDAENAIGDLYSTKMPEIKEGSIKNTLTSYQTQLQSLESDLDKIGGNLGKKISASIPQDILTGYKTSIQSLKTEFENLFEEDNINYQDFISQMAPEYSARLANFSAINGSLETFSQFTATDHIDTFTTKLSEAHDKIIQLFSSTKDTSTLRQELEQIIQTLLQMNEATKIHGKDGMLFSAGQINSIDDMRQKMEQYAQAANLGSKVNEHISDDGQTITQTYKTASGSVYTLTGKVEQLTKAWRANLNMTKGTNSFMKGFTSSFSMAIGQITRFASVATILNKVRQEFQSGLNTFKEYDKALTQISYTMNLSKAELSDLGQSAIDMAKDLSMSVSNAESVFQIYANMNTTAEEIQKTAKPTVILSNLSGVDASKAADEVQGILQQFNMLKDSEEDVADVSMHIVDVLDNISANVAMDYSKGIDVITQAVTATGQVAYDAGMSFEQLAAISAKVAERTREDGSTIGNALKTIITRTSKVNQMPQYAEEVDSETLSKASESLSAVGIKVYETNGEMRDMITILSELREKWDTLSDAQQSNIAYNIAATRQTSKFKNILEAWNDAMSLADQATTAQGNALANQEKYQESFAGKTQEIRTQMDAFWISFFNSDAVDGVLDFIINLIEGFNKLAETITPVGALLTTVFGASMATGVGRGLFSFIGATTGIESLGKAMTKLAAGSALVAYEHRGLSDIETELIMKTRFASIGFNEFSLAEMKTATAGMTLRNTLLPIAATIAAISVAVYAGYKAYQKYGKSTDLLIKRNKKIVESQKEITKQHQEAIDENNRNADSLQNLLERYEQAEVGSQDYYNVRQQIAEQFPEMIVGYDSEGRAIVANTELIRQQIEAYRNLSVAEQAAMRKEAKQNANDIVNGSGEVGIFGRSADGFKDLVAQREELKGDIKELEEGIEEYNQWLKDEEELINSFAEGSKERAQYEFNFENAKLSNPNPTVGNLEQIENYKQQIKDLDDQLLALRPMLQNQYALIAGDISNLTESQIDAITLLENIMSRYGETGDDFEKALKQIKLSSPKKAKEFSETLSALLTPDLSEISASEYASTMESRLNEVSRLLGGWIEQIDYDLLADQFDFSTGQKELEKQFSAIISNGRYTQIAENLGLNWEEAIGKAFDNMSVKEAMEFNPDDFLSDNFRTNFYSKWKDVIESIRNETVLGLQGVDWSREIGNTRTAEGSMKQLTSTQNALGIIRSIINTGMADDIQSAINKMAEWGWIADDTANGVKKTFDEAKTDISASVTSLIKANDLYNTSVTEMNKNGHLSTETYNELIAANSSYKDAIIETASGVTLDTKKIKTLNKQEKKSIQDKVIKYRKDLVQQYKDNAEMIDKYRGELINAQSQEEATRFADLISALLDSNSAITDNISSLGLLQNELSNTTSAWNEWQTALNSGNPSDQYDTLTGYFKTFQEAYEKGRIGTDDYMSFVKLMTGIEDQDIAQSEAMYDYITKLGERYFTEDQTGVQNLLDDIRKVYKENGLKDLLGENGEVQIINADLTAQLLSEMLQKKYGENAILNTEALQLLFKAFPDFGMGNPLSDGTYVNNIDGVARSIEVLKEKWADTEEGSLMWDLYAQAIERAEQKLEEMKILQDTVMSPEKLTELLDSANQAGYTNPETGAQEELSVKLVYDNVEQAQDDYEKLLQAQKELLTKQEEHPELFTEQDQESLNSIISLMTYVLGQKQELEKPFILKVDTSQIEDQKLKSFVETAQAYLKAHRLLSLLTSQGKAGTSEAQTQIDNIMTLRQQLQELDQESGGQFTATFGIDLNAEDLPTELSKILGIEDTDEETHTVTIMAALSDDPASKATIDFVNKLQEGHNNVDIYLRFHYTDENGNELPESVRKQLGLPIGKAPLDSSSHKRYKEYKLNQIKPEILSEQTEQSSSQDIEPSPIRYGHGAKKKPSLSSRFLQSKYVQKRIEKARKELDEDKDVAPEEPLEPDITLGQVISDAVQKIKGRIQKEVEEETNIESDSNNPTAEVPVGAQVNNASVEEAVTEATEMVENSEPAETEVNVNTEEIAKAQEELETLQTKRQELFSQTPSFSLDGAATSWVTQVNDIDAKIAEVKERIANLQNGEEVDIPVELTTEEGATEKLSHEVGTVPVEAAFQVVSNGASDSGYTYNVDTSDAEKGLEDTKKAAENATEAVQDTSKQDVGNFGTPNAVTGLDNVTTAANNTSSAVISLSQKSTGDLGTGSAQTSVNNLKTAIQNVGTAIDNLNGKTATMTIQVQTSGGTPSGGGDTGLLYKGTAAFAHGTWSFGKAFAKGNIGAPRSEEALVGELGPEMRVRGSRWELLGEHGPEFRDIRKDDIIFNADQTADLLSRGKTNSRGKAFAHGTNGSAYIYYGADISGNGGNIAHDPPKPKKTKSKTKTTTPRSSSDDTKISNDTKKETKSLLDTLKEGWGKVIDWVALKLESYSKQLDKFITQAERTWQKFNYRDQAYDRAIRKTDASIDLTKRAKDRYDRRATGVLAQGKKAIGMKGADARKAQKEIDEAVAIIRDGGNVKHIKQYSDDAKTVIEEYQKWYDLAKDTQDKLDELEDQRHELEKSRVELLTNRFESKINHVSAKAERVQSQISALESMDMMADPKQYERLNNFNQQQINLYTQQIEAFEKGQSKVAKYSEDWYEYQDSIDSARASIDDLTTSMIENAMSAAQLHTQLAQLKNEKLDKQNDILDAKIERDQIGITDRRGITAKGLNVRSYVYQKNANTGQKIDNLRRANSSNASNVTSATTNLTNAKQTEEYSSLMQQIISSANGTDSIPANLVTKIYNALRADPSNKTLQSFYRKVLDYNAAIKAYTEGKYDYQMAQIQAKADAQANAEAMKSNREARRDARNEKAENLYNITANLYENESGTNFGYGQSKRDAELRKINANNKSDDRHVKEMLSDLNSIANKNSSSITKELRKSGSANKKGYKQALKNAQSAMSSKKLISDGDINVIQKYNPKLAIQLLTYNFQVGNVEEARLERATNYAANNARKDELINEKYEKKKSIADNQIERNDAYIENGTSDSERNRYLAKNNHQIDHKLQANYDKTQEFLTLRDTSARKINKQIKKEDLEGMPKHYQQAIDHAMKDVKNGYSIGDEFLEDIAEGNAKHYISDELYQAFIDYKEANEWYRQSKYAQELEGQTLKKQKAQNSVKMLQNIATEHERRRANRTRGRAGENIRGITGYNRNGTNATAANRSFAQTMGHYTNVADIENDIMTATENYADAYQEYQKLKDKFAEQYKKGAFEEGSDEWHEQLDIIENARQNMDGFVQTIEELKVEMRNLEWQKFDDMMESVKRLNAEFEYFQGLIANETFFDEDNKGHITRYGMASGFLHKEAYQTDLSNALRYRDELDDLNAKVALGVKNGGYDGSSKEVIDRQRQLTDAIRESVNAAEAEKQALIDLVRQGYEAQLSALNKSISKYKDLKNAEKEAYDYQKDIADQTKNITNLQKQLAAFEGNTSEESVATVQKLQSELEQAESDLQDKQYEKYLSDAEDMLDDLSNNFQEWIEYYMKDRDQVFDDMLNELRGISSHLGDNLGTLYRNSKDTVDLLKNVESDYFADSGEILSTLSDSTKVALTDIKNDNTNLNEKVVDGIEEGFDKLVDKQSWREDVEKQNNKHGFASGSKRILSDQLAWTQENGTEAIYRKSDGAILTPLGAGDMVFTHAMTEKLWDLASMNIPDMIKHSFAQPVIQNQQDVVMSPNTNIQMNITLPNVKNYDEFKQAMLNDKQFQNGVQAMTLGAAMGQNSLSKLKYS